MDENEKRKARRKKKKPVEGSNKAMKQDFKMLSEESKRGQICFNK